MSEALTARTPSPTRPDHQPARAGTPHNDQKPSCAVNSIDILRGSKAVDIEHNGLIYRLQATRLGKLILTK